MEALVTGGAYHRIIDFVGRQMRLRMGWVGGWGHTTGLLILLALRWAYTYDRQYNRIIFVSR